MAVEELALKRREEALTHRVVVRIADRAHGRPNTHLLAATAERERRVLAALSEWWMALVGRRRVIAMLSASSTSSVRKCVVIAHPTTRRLHASSTTAR